MAMPDRPEQQDRRNIDSALSAAGWLVQDRKQVNITARRVVAIREFPLKSGHGFADYLLYLDGAAASVVEAKKEGVALTGVELQTSKYSEGLPDGLPAPRLPLPLCYQSTGTETPFKNYWSRRNVSRRERPSRRAFVPSREWSPTTCGPNECNGSATVIAKNREIPGRRSSRRFNDMRFRDTSGNLVKHFQVLVLAREWRFKSSHPHQ